MCQVIYRQPVLCELDATRKRQHKLHGIIQLDVYNSFIKLVLWNSGWTRMVPVYVSGNERGSWDEYNIVVRIIC